MTKLWPKALSLLIDLEPFNDVQLYKVYMRVDY